MRFLKSPIGRTFSTYRVVVAAAVGLTLELLAGGAWAGSNTYCAVEVGSKGVKGRGFEFGVKDAESSIRTTYNRDINTTIIATMKDGEFTAPAIVETADAVATLIKEMRAATPDCKAFSVGSSGLAVAKNRDALSEAVNQRVDIGGMNFVTAEEEAEYGFITVVPKREWANAVLIDIGSSNTKLGYKSDGKFKAAELPLGSVTLTKKASDGGADFPKALGAVVDSTVRPAFREIASRIPGIMNRKRVYWIGGAAWGTATFMRPDQAARDFVRMDKSDVKRFLGALNDKTWTNYKPSKKASHKAREAFEKDSAKVVEVFSRDNLASGVSIFDAFLNDRGVDGPIQFVRNSQWILGYASAKFAEDIWSEDALE